MSESINSDDLLSYINEELITNNSNKNEYNEEIYNNYIKTDNNGRNINNATAGLNEKSKVELAQAALLNSLTNNVYNQTLPLSPPQDSEVNSPNSEIYLNSQNIPSNTLSLSNSPSMELEALSPSSMGSEVNEVKSEEPNLMDLTQIYQNNGLIGTNGIINPAILSQYQANSEFINNNALLNAMCTDDDNKSQLFPQVIPNTNISIPSTTYINDTLNPLSTVNISIPSNTNVPVTLNTDLTLPTVTVPSNVDFNLPTNTLNLSNPLATTAALDIDALQSLTPLAMSGPLALTNTNTSINPSTIINSLSTSTADAITAATATATTLANPSKNINSIASSVAPSTVTTSTAPLSATLDLNSLKSSVNETLELTKKLSQTNGNIINSTTSASTPSATTKEDVKPKVIDVTDILKSDVAASCLNLLKGSKGKPGRKKKCIQNSSESGNTSSGSTGSSGMETKPFPFLKPLVPSTENGSSTPSTTGTTGTNPTVNILPANSVKFPIIKPKAPSNDTHTPILPLAPATTKSNTINVFANPLLPKNPAAKPLNSSLILPNATTDKSNANSNANNAAKTAYQKRQERLLKNREAAHLSRKRKREQLHMLETHAQELIAENQTLKLKVIELEQLNEKLMKENELLKKMNQGNPQDNNMNIDIKKEVAEIPTTAATTTTNAISSDIYNLYIKSEAMTNGGNGATAQNSSNNKSKEIGIVFMVILFSFSLFTFPLSIFSGKSTADINSSLISSFMNKISDFSLSSVSSENAGKILSSGYEQEKPFLLDSGHYEIANTQNSKGELEVRSLDTDVEERRLRRRSDRGRETSHFKKSRRMAKDSGSSQKSKSKTGKMIKKNYEYTSFNEISSLMSVFHPKNVELDEDTQKQMSQLQHWIVEGFCSIHENHTFAKDSSNVKDIIKIYSDDDDDDQESRRSRKEDHGKSRGSTDLTVKKNNKNGYYDSSKSFAKEIPWNMKQFIKFYPDTTYFYSPKLVQLFPLSSTEISESTIPLIHRLQPNDTVEAHGPSSEQSKETIVRPSTTSHYPASSYGEQKPKKNVDGKENIQMNEKRQSSSATTKSESQDNGNVYHLPFTNKPKMAIITNIESDDIDEESNSYLMIDFEIKGARLIENE